MCIIIDTNVLSHVFDKNNQNHAEFKPVLDWIINGNGKIIYGGSKYKKEIGEKLIRVFLALRKANKAIKLDDNIVDAEAARVSKLIQHDDFDDQHIVALLIKSGCRLICSLDSRAYPFFQHNTFFSSRKKPRIYSGIRNSDLLANKNIANLCKPCVVLNNKTKAALGVLQ